MWMLLIALTSALADDPGAAPSPDAIAIVEALTPRHARPDCAVLAAQATSPGAALVAVAEQVQQPPWVAIRAARCAPRHAEVHHHVAAWMDDPDRRGLALAALGALVPADDGRAHDLARRALTGPHAEGATAVLARSDHAELRAVLAPTAR